MLEAFQRGPAAAGAAGPDAALLQRLSLVSGDSPCLSGADSVLSSASDNLNILTATPDGGDDFLAKPFDLNILAAKVQALLRRAYDFAPPAEFVRCGDLRLNLNDGTVERGEQRTR